MRRTVCSTMANPAAQSIAGSSQQTKEEGPGSTEEQQLPGTSWMDMHSQRGALLLLWSLSMRQANRIEMVNLIQVTNDSFGTLDCSINRLREIQPLREAHVAEITWVRVAHVVEMQKTRSWLVLLLNSVCSVRREQHQQQSCPLCAGKQECYVQ